MKRRRLSRFRFHVSKNMVSLDTLRLANIFEGLADDQLARVAKIAHEETIEPGKIIFKENDEAQDLYVVLEGRVAILIDIGGGKQTMVDTVTKGEPFAWSALVPPYMLTASAKTVERTRVLVMPGKEMHEFCLEDCRMCYTIMENLARTISTRLKDTRLQLISLMHG